MRVHLVSLSARAPLVDVVRAMPPLPRTTTVMRLAPTLASARPIALHRRATRSFVLHRRATPSARLARSLAPTIAPALTPALTPALEAALELSLLARPLVFALSLLALPCAPLAASRRRGEARAHRRWLQHRLLLVGEAAIATTAATAATTAAAAASTAAAATAAAAAAAATACRRAVPVLARVLVRASGRRLEVLVAHAARHGELQQPLRLALRRDPRRRVGGLEAWGGLHREASRAQVGGVGGE